MIKFFKKLLVFIILIAVPIVWWKINFPSGTWRYRITVEVETPEGIRSGSAVREIFARQPLIRFHDGGRSPGIRGEAVVVDLGARGVLFSLIDWNSFYEVYDSFPFEVDAFGPEGIRYYRSLKAGLKAPLVEKNKKAMFVMFTDINDPMSVTLVRGGRFNAKTQKVDLVDDFEALFGAGVRLKSITVEITDDPVTWGVVEKWLPWLPKVLMSNIDGTSVSFENKLSNTLHGGNFKTGKEC